MAWFGLVSVFVGAFPTLGQISNAPATGSANHVFSSAGDAARSQQKTRLENQARSIQQMERIGMPPDDVLAMRERMQMEQADGGIRSWTDWTNRYRPEFINPPVRFDAHEPWALNFSSPMAAVRSYKHALYIGQAKALLQHADASQKLLLQPEISRSSPVGLTNLSRFTVLLVASNSFSGKDYVVVLSRMEATTNPQTNRVAFSMDLFAYENGRLLISGDLSLLSPFRAVTVAARANGANLLPYPQFYERVKHSAFPAHFYTITE